MPASTAVPGLMATIASILLLMISSTMAQSASPSNAPLPANMTGVDQLTLTLSGMALPVSKSYTLAPLTPQAGMGLGSVAIAAFSILGNVKLVDYSSARNLSRMDIALISCDPTGSNIDASTVIDTAGNAKPMAIILYSLSSAECSIVTPFTYQSMFTMTSTNTSQDLVNSVRVAQASVLMGTINGNKNANTTTVDTPGGPAPTTAVAMSILYSITGIITLLFLVIIATGAVRAHRHPERYGPRNGFPGRPRQSRAKGLARAMLETLPIVKFGDPEPVKPGQDIELEDGRGPTPPQTEATPTMTSVKGEVSHSHLQPHAAGLESGLGAAEAESVHSHEEVAAHEGELGCSICTEDFTTGEDVRVLPCNHKYHPACIDPWLLNVSGTCPLCRLDLRPETTNGPHPDGTEGDELPPPLSINEGADGHASGEASLNGDAPHRSRVSRVVDLGRLRHAPADERIAALRTLREETSREQAPAVVPAEDSEERGRRARLSRRLRDTFRIRTRTGNNTTATGDVVA